MLLLLKLCLCPQNYGAMQTLPRKITKPYVLCAENLRDFVLCPAELWSNADFVLQNHGDIVSGSDQYPKRETAPSLILDMGKKTVLVLTH